MPVCNCLECVELGVNPSHVTQDSTEEIKEESEPEKDEDRS